MLDSEKWLQYGEPRKEKIKGITIHNTGNTLSALDHERIMAESRNHLATHFFVDENEIVQVMPLDWMVWHTGHGYDMGNTRTIAIEICRSMNDIDTYMRAQNNAVRLIRKLMVDYGLDSDHIYFHSNFDNVYCPHRILEIYGSLENFKKGVQL